MFSISTKIFWIYIVRQINEWGKYWTAILFFLYLFYFTFYKCQWLIVELEQTLTFIFITTLVGFLITSFWQIKGIRQAAYHLDEEGHFNFNLINFKEGLLDEEPKDLERWPKSFFSLNFLTFYLIGGTVLLAIVFPGRHLEMKNNLLRAFDILPPPDFHINYSKVIKENSVPVVQNLSKYPMWIRWHGLTTSEWKSLNPGEKHLGSGALEVDTLELSLRYEKKTYYKSFPIKTLLKPRLGKVEWQILSPFNTLIVNRGQSEIKAYPKSQITLTIFPIEGREFSEAQLQTKSGQIVSSRGSALGGKISLSWVYSDGDKIYWLKLGRLEDDIHSDPILLKISPLSNQIPMVVIEKPAGEITVNESSSIGVHYLVQDDASLKDVFLVTIKGGEEIIKNVKTFLAPRQVYRGRANLDLKNLGIFPGDTLDYYLNVKDFYGLEKNSSTNSIIYLSIHDSIQRVNTKQSYLHNDVRDGIDSAKEINQEVKKMKIMAERGDITKKALESFSRKVEETRNKLISKKEAIQSTLKKIEKGEINITPSIETKLIEIQKNIQSLDQNFLKAIGAYAKKMVQQVNLTEEEMLTYFKEMKSKKLEQKLDEILGETRQLKKIQNYFKLEELANQLYEHHEDLVSQAKITETVEKYNKNKKEVEVLLDEFAKAWKEMNYSNSNNSIDRFSKNESFSNRLTRMQKAFKEFKARSSQDKKIDEFSSNFANIRKQALMLSKQFQQMDTDAIYREIDEQVLGLTFESDWLNRLLRGQLLDLEQTKHNLLKEKMSLFISEIEGSLKKSRRDLYELLIGYMSEESALFNLYDEILDSHQLLKKKIDPATSINPIAVSRLIDDLKRERENYLVLTHRLVQLKKLLKNQQDKKNQQEQRHQAEQRQKRLNQRNNNMLKQRQLTQSQQQYLKQAAKEQTLIRSLLKGMYVGQGEKEQKGTGKKNNNNEDAKKTKQLVKEMEELEEYLKNYQPGDFAKIAKKQEKIEEVFLQFDKGLSQGQREKKDKGDRIAKTAKQRSSPNKNTQSITVKMIKKLEKELKIQKYPPEYKQRVLNYLNALRLSP